MDTFKVALVVLVWTFSVLVIYMIANVMVFEYIAPTFDDIANNTSFVDQSRYATVSNIIKTSFNTACFILLLIPYAYLFVRAILKKEQTAQPAYVPAGGGF